MTTRQTLRKNMTKSKSYCSLIAMYVRGPECRGKKLARLRKPAKTPLCVLALGLRSRVLAPRQCSRTHALLLVRLSPRKQTKTPLCVLAL